MDENTLNNILNQIESLNKLFLENKESSSKVMVFLANKNKELETKMLANDKVIMGIRNDINDIIEAENHSYNEIETIKGEIIEIKQLLNTQTIKIKEIESKLLKHQEENKKTEKSFDMINKSLFESIDSLKTEQTAINEKFSNIQNSIEVINNNFNEKLVDTKNYILFDRRNNNVSKLRKFFYRIFNYRKLKQLEFEKEQQIKEEQLRKEQEENQKKQDKLNQIKNILNSTKKPN